MRLDGCSRCDAVDHRFAGTPSERTQHPPPSAEMLDFCGEKNVTADVEVISIKTVNEAMERMLKSDVKYRFVIDIARTLTDESA